MTSQTAIISLFGPNDPRYGELTVAILETIRERGEGLLFLGILGALRMAEDQLIAHKKYEECS